jgi:hypothetical protein
MLALVLVLGSLALLSVSPEPRYAFSWITFLTIPTAVVLMRIFGGADGALEAEADASTPTASAEAATEPSPESQPVA